jgi:hypothetical protein
MHYNTMIRMFCILKKMTSGAFHYLTVSVRCEELDALSRFSLRDKVSLRLLKLYFYIADVVEWSRVLDIMISEI